MFENMVKSATFPAIWEALNAVEHELTGVRERLEKMIEQTDDDMTRMLSRQQMNMLDVWQPMIANLVNDLHRQHTQVHGAPPPKILR